MEKLFFIFLLSCPFLAFSQAPTPAQKFFQDAVFLADSNPDEAFAAFEKAINQAKGVGDHDVLLKSIHALIRLDYSDGNQKQKVFAWAKEAAQKVGEQETFAVAQLHYDVAGLFFVLTLKTDSTLYHFNRVLTMPLESNPATDELLAKSYNDMGNVYRYRALDFMEAERCYDRALLIRERSGLNDEYELARIYYALAATNRAQQDHDKALAYAIKTLALVKASGNLAFFEITCNMVGNIYRERKQFDLAKDYYNQAIDLNKKTKDGSRTNLAIYYTNLAEAIRMEGNLPQALNFFNLAASIFEKATGDDRLQYVFCLQQTLIASMQIKDDARTVRTFRRLNTLLRDLNLLRSHQAAELYQSYGTYLLQKNKPDSALWWYQNSLRAGIRNFNAEDVAVNPTLSEFGMNYRFYQTLFQKALAFESLYRKGKDIAFLESSITCLHLAERLLAIGRNSLDVEESKWKFLDSNFDLSDDNPGISLYEKAIALLFELSSIKPNDSIQQRVFYFFERSKSQALANAISDSEKTHHLGIPDSILSQRENLKMTLFSLQDKLERETDQSAVNQLRGEMVSVDRKVQNLKNYIEEKFPAYFQAEFEYVVPGIIDLQNWTKKKDITVLEYFVGKKDVYAFSINENGVHFIKVANVDSVSQDMRSLLAHFTGTQSSLDESSFISFRKNAYSIFQQLVAPFQEQLGKRVLIIPDGLISQIPFEVLIDKENTDRRVSYKSLSYLLSRYTISYAYSSTSLLNQESSYVKKPSLLAMAFTNGDRLRAPDPQLKEIIGTEKELDALGKYFATGRFIVGDEATEHNFKKLVPDYDIVHLAIHGKGDPERSYSSSLFFRSLTDSIEDGELHAYELYGLKLKARLAVLSSCESGLGKSYTGEGMVSMASAFTYAGCHDILMSLWKVQDQIAVQLMDDFYRELISGKSIDEALALSKLRYLEQADDLTADPKTWAPVISYGNQDAIYKKERSKAFYYLIGSVLTLLLLMWVLRSKIKTG